MPLFISDDEFRLIAHDASAVVDRANAFIRDVRRQIDTVRAEADAAEQNCALLEHKYSSLYSDFSRLQSDNAQLSASVELRLSEIADAQAEKHQLHLKADGETERMTELRKAKRQLLELIEQKDVEIREKNAAIQSYLDKIVNLAESNTSKEARVHESETELGRCRAAYSRVTQEKELLEKHNAWLKEELTAKVNSLVELRTTHMDIEADLSLKLADHERQLSESSNSLKWNKERVYKLELRVNSLEEELRTSKEAAAANEERFAAELLTELLKKSWESEKVELQQLKTEAERKHNEVNEQNKILHNRLEALHIKLANKEHSSSGFSSQSLDSLEDNDFQTVVSYLHHSKEIAETEISLLKLEKLRLQSQLEVALKASENAQALLHSQCENSRTQLFKDEEFKALQLQAREVKLLRESNVQLRAENKHNFEESQKLKRPK